MDNIDTNIKSTAQTLSIEKIKHFHWLLCFIRNIFLAVTLNQRHYLQICLNNIN